MLDDLSEGYRVLHDVESPYGNIDHLVISQESGIFLLETKALGARSPWRMAGCWSTNMKMSTAQSPRIFAGESTSMPARPPVWRLTKELKIKPGSLPAGMIVGTVEIVGYYSNNGEYEWHLAFPGGLEQLLKPENHLHPVWFKSFNDHD